MSLLVSVWPSLAATFPTNLPNNGVVSLVGGAADIVLDEPRNRLYLVNSQLNQLQIYQTSVNPPRLQTSIRICNQPVAAALSLDNNSLYITCFSDSSLVILNVNAASPSGTKPVSLPASPEAVAVGGDGRVLISTIGTGQGRETLLSYDPSQLTGGANPFDVTITPPAPASPVLPPPNGRIFGAYRSHLQTTPDGRYIVGVNNSGNNRIVFVYEVASRTVLRSRIVTNLSGVLSIAPDGSKFMAGATLFDFKTLQVLAQQNAANATFTFPGGNTGNFNLQQNQGGSIFSPDGKVLYSAFNIAPVQNPPARANVTQLLFNDPDNLLITLALQLPENLAGKMVITKDGKTIYALSDSGFTVLPISTMNQSPIAMPDQRVVLLADDQCGVTASQQTGSVNVKNMGGGNRMTVTAQLLPTTSGAGGLGGFGGPGGGGTAGGVIIILPGIIIGGGAAGGINGFGAPGTAQSNTAAGTVQTAPLIRPTRNPDGSTSIDYLFNPNAARQPGTVPPHDFLIQSPEAINVAPNVRVFQNDRNSEDRGAVIPVPIGASNSEGLVEMLADNARHRLYITNSGMNRIEVFDVATRAFLAPIKVGQLPHSMAFANDGSTLYVGATGGEDIDIVDLDKMMMTGHLQFPALPFNAGFSLITPSVLASSARGLQIIMSDGTLWHATTGNTAEPRPLNPAVFGNNVRVVPAANPVTRTMASTPDGQFVILATSSGFAYLYSAGQDDFVVSRQIFNPPLTGFIGPISAGPGGRYYLVNNIILNDNLTPIGGAPSFTISQTTTPTTTGTGPGGTRPGTPNTPGIITTPNQPPLPGTIPGGPGLPTRGTVTITRPISAVAAVGNNNFLRFSQPVLLSNTAQATDAGVVELVDVNNGNTMFYTSALEGPLTTVTNNGRAAINGRTMAVDPGGATAYVLTVSGLTIVPMTPPNPAQAPQVNQNGVVSFANSLPNLAPGGLAAIFGKQLASDGSTSDTPWPTVMGGTCVTLNNQPLPLALTTADRINAQIPNTLPAGRYQLVVRSIDRQMSSQVSLVTVSKYAPAVMLLDSSGQPALYHQDGSLVTKDHKATRDEPLKLYATGLGVTTGGRVTPGNAAPDHPLAVTAPVQVFFGNPGYSQAQVIVDHSYLVPGMVGLNELDLRIPGNHLKGDALPIQLRIGGVFSPTTGANVPHAAVE
jgi:uncharacterized protein (TIGR03437 family)